MITYNIESSIYIDMIYIIQANLLVSQVPHDHSLVPDKAFSEYSYNTIKFVLKQAWLQANW